MYGSSLIALLCLVLALPAGLYADDSVEVLESVAAANASVQPGLQNYLATVEIPDIMQVMNRFRDTLPAEAVPALPVIKKFWQRDGMAIFFIEDEDQPPYVEQLIKMLDENLAKEPGELLLPPDRSAQRRTLMKGASIKLSEVSLAENLIRRLEISFEKPTDLKGAFYVAGTYLPEDLVATLVFDIDSRTKTVSELQVARGDGLRLAAEIRYVAVAGGYLPERFKITSPDGKIDDLFEIKFTEFDGYLLPGRMLRSNRSPGREENLEVLFKDFQVNQPVPERLKERLEGNDRRP